MKIKVVFYRNYVTNYILNQYVNFVLTAHGVQKARSANYYWLEKIINQVLEMKAD